MVAVAVGPLKLDLEGISLVVLHLTPLAQLVATVLLTQ
jgi:hypothetical protein